jgi:GNAT superfamily N-acetyltransferase
MEAAQPQLVITEASIAHDRVEVLVLDGQIGGFFRLCRCDNGPHKLWLEDLFLDPSLIGQGWGRVIWNRVIETAASLGCRVLEWETDPHAEPFYQRMGAVRVGQRESTLFLGRMLPVMRCVIADRSTG